MKKITIFVSVALSILLSLPGYAQEVPPGNVIVNTICTINEGHSFNEAVEVARYIDYDREDAPNLVFYRQPIAAGTAPAGGMIRTVYWDNLAHWARSAASRPAPSGASAHLNEIVSCDDANRSFFINRNIDGAAGAYAGGENQQSLSAARVCELRPGNTIEDVYTALVEINAPYRQQGDQTTMQLSHRFMGPQEGGAMGSSVIIRLVGETAEGLAARIDMSPRNARLAGDAPVVNCQDQSLWSSHVIHWGL